LYNTTTVLAGALQQMVAASLPAAPSALLGVQQQQQQQQHSAADKVVGIDSKENGWPPLKEHQHTKSDAAALPGKTLCTLPDHLEETLTSLLLLSRTVELKLALLPPLNVLSSPTDSTRTLASSTPYKLELKNCAPFDIPLHVQRVLLPGAVHVKGGVCRCCRCTEAARFVTLAFVEVQGKAKNGDAQ
jgi:hypothetical protein